MAVPMWASETTAAIIGLGQIGGSLALALKKAGFFKAVVGCDRNSGRLEKAGAFLDLSCADVRRALDLGDVIILAAPVRQNMAILEEGSEVAPDKLYTDVGSTKQAIVARSRELALKRFVAGHPMTGSEKPGERGWDETLFVSRPYFWIPQDGQNPEDVQLLLAMIGAIGAVPRPVQAERHDEMLALTSHLPLLIAAGFVEILAGRDPGIGDFLGGGFRSTARLAGGGPEMARDLMLTNQSYILDAVADFTGSLDRLCADIRAGREDAILDALRACQAAYRRMTKSGSEGAP